MEEECSYCDKQFDSKAALANHYGEEHSDDLSQVDERFVEQFSGEELDLSDYRGIALLSLLAVLVAVGAALIVLQSPGESFTGSNITPRGIDTVHYHGQITVEVDGKDLDFSRDKFQLQSDAVHFEGGEGTRWHVHARRVTIEYFLLTLGFDRVGPESLEYNNTFYSESDGDTVRYTVNGQQVDPTTYILREGDSVVITVMSSDHNHTDHNHTDDG